MILLYNATTGAEIGHALCAADHPAVAEIEAHILAQHADVRRARFCIDHDEAVEALVTRPDPDAIVSARPALVKVGFAMREALTGESPRPLLHEVVAAVYAALDADPGRRAWRDPRGVSVGWIEAADQSTMKAMEAERDAKIAAIPAYMADLKTSWR